MSGELTRIGEGLFRIVRRGYDREEVDDYVAQLQRRIQELQERSSQEGAVRAALNQVGEDVSAVLQQSHQTATQIVNTAQAQADELTANAQAQANQTVTSAQQQAASTISAAQNEAAEHRRQAVEYATEIVTTAERRVQELDRDTDRIWAERERIVVDARDLSKQLQGVADQASERFPGGDPSSPPVDSTGGRSSRWSRG